MMGHERSVAVSSMRSDRKQQSFLVSMSPFWNKVLQGCHVPQITGDFNVQMWTHMCTSQSGKLVLPNEDICKLDSLR